MSLTSYRAAPPRVMCLVACWHVGKRVSLGVVLWCGVLLTWRRPTFPCLETQYHGRCGVSRPSSGWDRVGHPRCDHQVGRTSRSGVLPALVLGPIGLAACLRPWLPPLLVARGVAGERVGSSLGV
jgi:hypothetical protein